MNVWSYLLERPLVEYLGPPARRAVRHAYQHDISIALLTAVSFHLAVMLTALMLRSIPGEDAEPGEPEETVWIFESYSFSSPAPKVPKMPKFDSPRPPKAPREGIPIAVHNVIEPDTTRIFEPAPVDAITEPWDSAPLGDGAGDGHGTSQGGGSGGNGNGYGEGVGSGAYPPADSFLVLEIQPKLVAMEAPDYPELAKMARIEGSVLVRVLVAKDGRVKKVVLLKGANPLLDQAALAASRQAIFKPAIQHREPVAAWVNIPFRFSLH